MLKLGSKTKPSIKETTGSNPLGLPVAGKFNYEIPTIKKRKKKNGQIATKANKA
ncbi:MAG: hypothetical protein KGI58_04125 [Patescibacteria group bacterium]|nr:hypothetical protein [Patescibacteria group bacterium]